MNLLSKHVAWHVFKISTFCARWSEITRIKCGRFKNTMDQITFGVTCIKLSETFSPFCTNLLLIIPNFTDIGDFVKLLARFYVPMYTVTREKRIRTVDSDCPLWLTDLIVIGPWYSHFTTPPLSVKHWIRLLNYFACKSSYLSASSTLTDSDWLYLLFVDLLINDTNLITVSISTHACISSSHCFVTRTAQSDLC